MSLTHTDVVIVGGGVVGLTTALLLAAADLSLNITLIDAKPPNPVWKQGGETPDWDIRTSAITRFTQNIWVTLGVWPLIQEKRLAAYAKMAVYDAAGFGELHFDAAEIGEPDLGHIIENNVILTSLWIAVLENPAITVKAPLALSRLEIEEDRVLIYHANDTKTGLKTDDSNISSLKPALTKPISNLSSSGSNLSSPGSSGGSSKTRAKSLDCSVLLTKLLIGADGPNSWVRNQLGIACDKTPYGQAAIITTVRTERPHDFVAWQRFLPTGPLAFLPLSDPHLSSIVWTQPIDKAPSWCEQTSAQQAAELGYASDYAFGNVECLQTPKYFPLIKQHVWQYVKPGAALVGDAAHVMHPLAGQGVNVGIKDAFILTEEIKRALSARQSIGNYWALRRFERHRRAEVNEMLGLVSGLNTLFKSEASLIRSIRSFGLKHIDNNRFVKSWLTKQALGI